jgi:hypothetical protein
MKPLYIHLREPIVTTEEFEALFKRKEVVTDKDYSNWYPNPVEDAKFKEELGAENARLMEQEYEKTPPEAYQIGGTHYVDMKVQPWDVIDTNFDHAQAKGFYRGNALKYIMRAGCKGPAKEDYQKALHYLEKLIEIL